MHPAYTLYIGLGARVAEWKNDVYATVNKVFTEPTDPQNQVDEKKPLIVEKRVEEGKYGSEKKWREKK
ncbi:unnamed protein product [Fusarium graminearum]|uniref:Chromosome 4, complete genome n=1 Tax=Gibberella zeae (strain ATCC MYA-4620 / CBS 123657 / FGSC 9075 / NRRL 31084 / PH-1) TaxID=229533 RepID=A0A098DUL2_GIBZE|nr:unnamed protein product [Fusarium graminearum]